RQPRVLSARGAGEQQAVSVAGDVGDADLDSRRRRRKGADHRAERNTIAVEGTNARGGGERANDEFGFAVAVEIARGDAEPAGVVRPEREERQSLPAAGVEDTQLGGATGPGRANDLRVAVPVDVARRDADAAVERRLEGEEVAEPRPAVAAVHPLLAEDPDLGLHPGAWCGHELGAAVAIDIAEGDANATLEQSGIGREAPGGGAVRLVDDNRLVRPVRRRRPGRRRGAATEHDLRFAVAVEVARRK